MEPSLVSVLGTSASAQSSPVTAALDPLSKEAVVRREIAIMKKLRHRNIVSLHAVIDDATSDKMYLVMDYVPNGTLVRPAEGAAREAGLLYEPLEEEQCRDVFRQLVDGLRYLHRNGICHRDIKPENILCGSGGRVYLSDFGVSEIMSVQGSVSTKSSGTPTFWPPEMFSFETETLVSGAQVDIWALGVTLYMMLCGRSPFRGTSFLELSKSITCDEVTFPPSLSDDARGLLSSMLAKDPENRLTLKQIKHHPFMRLTELSFMEDRQKSEEVPPSSKGGGSSSEEQPPLPRFPRRIHDDSADMRVPPSLAVCPPSPATAPPPNLQRDADPPQGDDDNHSEASTVAFVSSFLASRKPATLDPDGVALSSMSRGSDDPIRGAHRESTSSNITLSSSFDNSQRRGEDSPGDAPRVPVHLSGATPNDQLTPTSPPQRHHGNSGGSLRTTLYTHKDNGEEGQRHESGPPSALNPPINTSDNTP